MTRQVTSALSILVAAASSWIAGCSGGPSADPAGFEIALWPGEGRPVLEARSGDLKLHAAPDLDASAKAVTVAPGRRIPFTATSYRTERPGEATALRRATIEGRDFGAASRVSIDAYYRDRAAAAVTVETGEAVVYLQNRAEGTCFVRTRGRVIEADPCVLLDPERFRLDVKPAVAWWVRIELPDGEGWAEVGRQLDVVARTF